MRLEEAIRALREDKPPLHKAVVRRLSNLDEAEQKQLLVAWGIIPVDTRRDLIRRLAETAEVEFDADFSALTRLALTDLDATVREAAIEASWFDESPSLLNRLLPMAAVDLAPEVRAAAWSAIGRFILLAEHGKFSSSLARQAQNAALRTYRNTGEVIDVRRRALEALANSSRDEVPPLIEEAYRSPDSRMRASAIYAMGRSCDDKWAKVVLRELQSDDPTLRFEAARAAGELGIEESVTQLGTLLVEGDRQTMEVAVWSLGEIGGSEAQRLLSSMIEYAEDRRDDDLLEMVEDALASASLAGGDFLID